jgi:MFS family permease
MYGDKTRPYAMGLWGVSALIASVGSNSSSFSTLFQLSAAAGPALGPVWGSFAVEAKGWRWSFWTMLWLSGFTLVLLVFLLPEVSIGQWVELGDKR